MRGMFPIAALSWAATLPLAPLAAGSPSVSTRAAAAPIYWLGGVVCHQRPDRSFQSSGQPWAVCARCTGIYAGAAAAVLGLGMARRKKASSAPDRSAQRAARLALAVGVVPTLLTVGVEFVSGQPVPNGVRVIAGIPIGLAAAWLVTREIETPVGTVANRS
jgi:uncharacterized membrane protein